MRRLLTIRRGVEKLLPHPRHRWMCGYVQVNQLATLVLRVAPLRKGARQAALDHLLSRASREAAPTARQGRRGVSRLALKTPEVRNRRQAGKLVCRPILGGLHHSYEWAA
jgi:hypothetical protein